MAPEKGKKFSKKVKDSKKWEKAEMLYSELHTELSMPPMLDLGDPMTPGEINTMLKHIIETCEAFYPAYMEKGVRNIIYDYGAAVKDTDTGFEIFLQLADKTGMEDEFDAFSENLAKKWRWDLIAKYGKEMINQYPRNAFYYDITSHALAFLNHEYESLKLGEKSVELDPNNKYFTNNLGFNYMIFNNLEKAAKMFEKSLNIDPEHKHAENNLNECKYLLKNNLTLKDYYLSPPDLDKIEKLADDDEWEEVDKLIANINFQRKLMFQLLTAPDHMYKDYPHPRIFLTLEPFFRFTSSLEQSYLLNEDIDFFSDHFRAIIHKFIFKHADVDDEILQEIFEGILLFYGFLSDHGAIEKENFLDFKEKISGMKDEMFTKMHRYNEIRHDYSISDEEKENIRDELFEGDHIWQML